MDARIEENQIVMFFFARHIMLRAHNAEGLVNPKVRALKKGY
jgi:hypothetical protein